MIKKSISYNYLNNIEECSPNRTMVKTKSYDSIQHMLSDDSKITQVHKIENVAALLSYAPINNVFKCIAERTFPVSLISDADDSKIDMGVCIMNSEKFIPKGIGVAAHETDEYDIINVLKNNIEKINRSRRRCKK